MMRPRFHIAAACTAGLLALACADAPFVSQNPWDPAVPVTVSFVGIPDSVDARLQLYIVGAAFSPAAPGAAPAWSAVSWQPWRELITVVNDSTIRFDSGPAPDSVYLIWSYAAHAETTTVFVQQRPVRMEALCPVEICLRFTALGSESNAPGYAYYDRADSMLRAVETGDPVVPGGFGRAVTTNADIAIERVFRDTAIVNGNATTWRAGTAVGTSWVLRRHLGLVDSVRVLVTQSVGSGTTSCEPGQLTISVGDTVRPEIVTAFDPLGSAFVGPYPRSSWYATPVPPSAGSVDALGDSAFVATAAGTVYLYGGFPSRGGEELLCRLSIQP